jgi:DNA-binding GntR family transcriptional regulator
MTQAQLAATAGTAKEVAARALAELEAAGAIKRAKGRIALADRQRLQSISDG